MKIEEQKYNPFSTYSTYNVNDLDVFEIWFTNDPDEPLGGGNNEHSLFEHLKRGLGPLTVIIDSSRFSEKGKNNFESFKKTCTTIIEQEKKKEGKEKKPPEIRFIDFSELEGLLREEHQAKRLTDQGLDLRLRALKHAKKEIDNKKFGNLAAASDLLRVALLGVKRIGRLYCDMDNRIAKFTEQQIKLPDVLFHYTSDYDLTGGVSNDILFAKDAFNDQFITTLLEIIISPYEPTEGNDDVFAKREKAYQKNSKQYEEYYKESTIADTGPGAINKAIKKIKKDYGALLNLYQKLLDSRRYNITDNDARWLTSGKERHKQQKYFEEIQGGRLLPWLFQRKKHPSTKKTTILQTFLKTITRSDLLQELQKISLQQRLACIRFWIARAQPDDKKSSDNKKSIAQDDVFLKEIISLLPPNDWPYFLEDIGRTDFRLDTFISQDKNILKQMEKQSESSKLLTFLLSLEKETLENNFKKEGKILLEKTLGELHYQDRPAFIAHLANLKILDGIFKNFDWKWDDTKLPLTELSTYIDEKTLCGKSDTLSQIKTENHLHFWVFFHNPVLLHSSKNRLLFLKSWLQSIDIESLQDKNEFSKMVGSALGYLNAQDKEHLIDFLLQHGFLEKAIADTQTTPIKDLMTRIGNAKPPDSALNPKDVSPAAVKKYDDFLTTHGIAERIKKELATLSPSDNTWLWFKLPMPLIKKIFDFSTISDEIFFKFYKVIADNMPKQAQEHLFTKVGEKTLEAFIPDFYSLYQRLENCQCLDLAIQSVIKNGLLEKYLKDQSQTKDFEKDVEMFSAILQTDAQKKSFAEIVKNIKTPPSQPTTGCSIM